MLVFEGGHSLAPPPPHHTGMPYVLGRMWEVEGGLCLRVGVVVGVVLVVFRSPLPSDGHGNGDP